MGMKVDERGWLADEDGWLMRMRRVDVRDDDDKKVYIDIIG